DHVYHFAEKAVMKKGKVVENGWWELNQRLTHTLYGGLFSGPQGQRIGIEAFVRLFQRTKDGRYLDSRICVDAFEAHQSCVRAAWFRD
ncbi:hypothetical protein AAVH_35750, partial [Aphelenchoides avenae]